MIPKGYKCISWYLTCGKTFDYFPPRFLHVLLLRLAHTFALPAVYYDPLSMENDVLATVWVYNRRCTMWKNGICWLMMKGGVECFVEMINNSKGIIVVTKSEIAESTQCIEMLFEIIRKIHRAKEEFCGTISLQEYYLHMDDSTPFIDISKLDLDDPIASTGDSLFLTRDIAQALKSKKLNFVISANGCAKLKDTKVSHLQEYIRWGKY